MLGNLQSDHIYNNVFLLSRLYINFIMVCYKQVVDLHLFTRAEFVSFQMRNTSSNWL